MLSSVLAGMLEPNVGGVNDGKVELPVDFVNPNEKVGAAGFISSFFELETVSDVADCAVKGEVIDAAGLAPNENPPGRGAVSFEERAESLEEDVLVVEVKVVVCIDGKLNVTLGEGTDLIALSMLIRGLSFCDVVVVEFLRMLVGDDTFVESIKPVLVVVSGDLETSLFSFLDGSTILDLIASDGAFKRDVVVAVLNVTDVIVLKLADVDELLVCISSFLSDFSTFSEGLLTLSTSSFDESSPRKKLNIIANFDF